MAQAGMADGFTLKVIAANDEPPTALAEAQNIQAQLADINIKVEIESLELSVYVDRWLAGDFEAAVALNGGRPDPYTMYARYWPSTGNLNNVAGSIDAEVGSVVCRRPHRNRPAGALRHLCRIPELHHGTSTLDLAVRRL